MSNIHKIFALSAAEHELLRTVLQHTQRAREQQGIAKALDLLPEDADDFPGQSDAILNALYDQLMNKFC